MAGLPYPLIPLPEMGPLLNGFDGYAKYRGKIASFFIRAAPIGWIRRRSLSSLSPSKMGSPALALKSAVGLLPRSPPAARRRLGRVLPVRAEGGAAGKDEAGTEARRRSGLSRRALVAAAAAAAAWWSSAWGKEEAAMALGPEGPLVEEFWDNVRRYALYMVTVSTGAIYTILQPIGELMRNPVSALLFFLLLGGSFYLLSQTLSFMVGLNDFAYDYAP
ncbi:uncharacterized protein LOC144710852 [Wolffia australiana]